MSKDFAELLAKAASDAQIRRVLAMDEVRRDASKRTIGITLILFTVCYLGGVYGGAAARIHGLPGLSPPTVPAERFPWTEHTRPATPERALDWVEVAAKMRALGHSDNQIEEVYGIDVARYNALLSQNAPRSFPWEGNETAPPTAQAALLWLTLQENLLERGFTVKQIEELYAIQVADWRNHTSGQSAGSFEWDFEPRAQSVLRDLDMSYSPGLFSSILSYSPNTRPTVGSECNANPICRAVLEEQFGTAARGSFGAGFLYEAGVQDLTARRGDWSVLVPPYGSSNVTLHFDRSQDPDPED